MESMDSIIKFNHVSFKYNSDEPFALNDVSFDIPKGKWTSIVGHNGSGKSTVAKLMIGIQKPLTGDIYYNHQCINPEHLSELRNHIGIVFQNPENQFVGATVEYDVAFGLENNAISHESMHEIVPKVLSDVDMLDHLNYEPQSLSGGQKQRVGIARALANEPNVLLCDEATSALDPQTTDEILDLLLKIKEQRNLTIVIITHEMQVIRRICDEVAVMENGRVIEQGAVTSVFENPQHDVTKRFVKDDLNDDFDESITDLVHIDDNSYIVRLNFTGNNTTEPLISYITKTHDIDVNILEANIKHSKDGSIGFLVLHLPSLDSEKFEKFKNDLEAQHVSLEVLKHG